MPSLKRKRHLKKHGIWEGKSAPVSKQQAWPMLVYWWFIFFQIQQQTITHPSTRVSGCCLITWCVFFGPQVSWFLPWQKNKQKPKYKQCQTSISTSSTLPVPKLIQNAQKLLPRFFFLFWKKTPVFSNLSGSHAARHEGLDDDMPTIGTKGAWEMSVKVRIKWILSPLYGCFQK